MLDLSKAFDSLPHGLLIAKLRAYGLNEDFLRLMESYLTEQYQRVKIDDSYSYWEQIINRVPQGSILGLILFNIFINDFFYITVSQKLVLIRTLTTLSFMHLSNKGVNVVVRTVNEESKEKQVLDILLMK